jgi:sugar phosphate isomerase/epimerase
LPPIGRFSVSQVMLPDSYSTFEEDVAACLDAGYGGIGIWSPKLGEGRDEELSQLMRQTGLKASVCGLKRRQRLA